MGVSKGEYQRSLRREAFQLFNLGRYRLDPSCSGFSGVIHRVNANIKHVNAFWADLDFKGGFDAATRKAQLAELTCKPSLIVASGGWHVSWLLDEPLLDVDTASTWMKVVQRKLQNDAVHDLARILRVPGTLNYKYNPPRAVKVIHATIQQYSPAELAGNLAANDSDPSSGLYKR